MSAISATVALLTHFYLILTQLSEKVEEVPQFVQGPEPRAVQPRISQDKLDSAAIWAFLGVWTWCGWEDRACKMTNPIGSGLTLLTFLLLRGPISKFSHTGSWGFNILIWRVGGSTPESGHGFLSILFTVYKSSWHIVGTQK